MQANCTIDITGHVAVITHMNGRVIAEILFHGPLDKVLLNCEQQRPILNGRPNIFRGELWGLAGYQQLDKENEEIVEK